MVLVSILMTLIGLEGLLRLFVMPLPDRFFGPNEDFGWFHLPGRQGWQATLEYRNWISINSHGLHDSEHSYEKPAGMYRILLLGDSYVEGLQVPLEDTVGKRLEAALNACGETKYEVINGGVSRFGTDNALLFYRLEGAKYQPDLVLLFFYHNDVTDNVEVPYFRLEGDTLTQVEPKPEEVLGPAGELRGWLWDHFHVYRLGVIGANVMASLLGLGQPPVEHRSKELYRMDYSPEIEQAWALTAALIIEIDRAVREDGAQFAVVGIGDIAAVEPNAADSELDWTRPNRELRLRLNDSGVTYINLLPAFQSRYAATGERLYWPGDQHWNAAGHRLAADSIYAELGRLGVVECR